MEPRVEQSTSRWLLWVGALWGGAILAGMGALYVYQQQPGASAEAPPEWPKESRLSLDRERLTLVMIVHPHCSCSHASVSELARLMADSGGRLKADVLFVLPEGVPEDWERTALWSRTEIITGVRAWKDAGGVEARRFGARTSGQTYVFDPTGALRFSGGLTPSRSHQGNSLGREAILALTRDEEPETPRSAAYGCSLHEEGTPFVLEDLRRRRDVTRREEPSRTERSSR